MKRKGADLLLCLMVFPAICSLSQSEPFSSRVVTTGLGFPWEIIYGPDGFIWVTERTDKQVTRVNPVTGGQTVAVTISEVYQSAGQDGLLGMALHPELLLNTANDFVYVAYTYDADAGAGINRRAKIRRYTYDATTQTLGAPLDILTNLPASNDHNSGRLAMGPDLKLYYAIGDQGHNQFNNMCLPVRAQDLPTGSQVSSLDWTRYQGKILRIELDGSIPPDNPVLSGVRSHIFSYGHRNAQGLAFGSDGKLYSCEHGPKSDDEINLVQPGKNYGWPHVAGYNDNQSYVYANWSAATSPSTCGVLIYSDYLVPPSVPTSTESSWSHPDFLPPIKTLFTVGNGFNFQDPACGSPTPNYFICWPTVAPASLEVYSRTTAAIPEWANSLLVVSLKHGCVYRMKLNAAGNGVISLSNGTDTTSYWRTTNRYRDIAQKSDYPIFYVATDNSGSTSGPSSGWTSALANPGSILEFQYTGILLDVDVKQPGGPPPVNRTSIQVFPNPAGDMVNIRMKKNIRRPFLAELYDVNGKLRKSMISAEYDFSMDLSALNPGIYFLKISNGYEYEVHAGKLIKKPKL